jgi:hypothetical protein
MRDADRIEAINSEQLATATDRLLLRASRQRFPRGSQARIADAAVPHSAPRFADGSQIVRSGESHPARFADASQPRIARTEGSQPRIVASGEVAHAAPARAPRAQGSQPRIVIAPSLAHPAPPKRASLPAMYALPERATSARRARSSQRLALMLLVPTMACIAAGITALL